MRFSIALAAVTSAAVAAGAMLLAAEPSAGQTSQSESTTLKPASSFASISDTRERSITLFREAGKVLQHPRCMNCHPASDTPSQTEAMRPHSPLVVRGADGHGAPGLYCNTCHREANFDPAGVPGHPEWHLAPREMAWQGKTLGEICTQIKDRSRNGNREMAALIHHMSEDSLVGWGWHPGGSRQPAPGTQAEFGALIKAWADSGAHCPS